MKAIELTAAPRDGAGKKAAREVRASGLLPAVLYGPGIDTRSLAVDRHDFVRLLQHHGSHALVTLKVDGSDYLALVKDVQIDPVRWETLHVDFVRVREDVAVATEVGVTLVGEAAGTKMGGVLELQTRSLQIEALPRSIPEHIEYDVSEMQIGDVVRVADITPPSGVTILTDPDETVARVAQPRLEVEAPPEAAEGAAAEGAAAAEEPAEGGEGS